LCDCAVDLFPCFKEDGVDDEDDVVEDGDGVGLLGLFEKDTPFLPPPPPLRALDIGVAIVAIGMCVCFFDAAAAAAYDGEGER